ncbi:4-hydroxy-tetrahydrodipicolinate reductase [Agromyces atrinae]|uniref:4-hydroxy-tetrahydrodipicolinate reductase n=1 Tax=Agromyces atrinae TaxID=592376 RepID=UPI0027E1245C|nr:4-hydroxy-tetrahydrodipicolinate reductase [Agromyces atrinae]
MTTSIAVVGITGTMGRLVEALIGRSDDLSLHAGLRSTSSLDEMLGADVVIDLTHPGASQAVVEFAVDHDIPLVVGTSGWSRDRIATIEARRRAAESSAGVLFIPNFSVGSVLGTTLSALAAPYFDSIEILEAHHAGKIDSPSGTAVRTAERIGEARSAVGPVAAPHTDQRARGQQVSGVPVHSMRLAGVLARQDVVFGGTGETLTITHSTLSASSYESGILLALAAARNESGVVVGLDRLLGLDAIGPRSSDPA